MESTELVRVGWTLLAGVLAGWMHAAAVRWRERALRLGWRPDLDETAGERMVGVLPKGSQFVLCERCSAGLKQAEGYEERAPE